MLLKLQQLIVIKMVNYAEDLDYSTIHRLDYSHMVKKIQTLKVLH